MMLSLPQLGQRSRCQARRGGVLGCTAGLTRMAWSLAWPWAHPQQPTSTCQGVVYKLMAVWFPLVWMAAIYSEQGQACRLSEPASWLQGHIICRTQQSYKDIEQYGAEPVS